MRPAAVMERLVATLMRYELRRSFRRVCWVGEMPALPNDTPIVVYANHHYFHDGYLLWLLTRTLDRPGLTWMVDWDRFPFFAAVGAHPFPPSDPARRRATIRRTARRFRTHPNTMLVYFPEGVLHAPEEGLLPFHERLARLGRLFPGAWWWPVALHVSWWGDARPTALLTGGVPHATPDGGEHARLERLWSTLRRERPTPTTTLLDGHRSPSDVWDFSFARRFFERYLSSPP